MPIVLFSLLLAGGASVLLTGLVWRFALHNKVLDLPNTRSSHSVPTPRGGGAAIVLAASAGIALASFWGAADSTEALTFVSGMLSLGIAGWADDRRGLPPQIRLAIHFAVALGTVAVLGGLPFLRVGNGAIAFGPIGYIVGILGIVWSINLFNFMDGIDGLAGSQAFLIFGTIAVLLFFRHDNSLATIAGILGAASVGFLVWNWPPAKIFLGDVGSGPIGYLIAAIAIASENKGSVPLLAFAIVYAVFIWDASVTLIRRFGRGARITEAHRDHAYQRITRAWGSHRAVTSSAAGVTLLLAILGGLATLKPRLLLPSLLVSLLVIGVLLLAVERRAPM